MKLLVSVLEPSGNLHVEPILDGLESYELFGIYDEKFGEPLLPSSAFSIMGFVDAIPKIRLAKKAIKKINPSVQIIYYILPQVWAWKAKRVAKVEQYCDVLASILPFEQEFYNKAIYVGHPLLDEISTCKDTYKDTGYISYLPGSRKGEIQKLMPIYKEVAKKIAKKNILVIPPHFSKSDIEDIYGDISEFEISKDTHESFLRSEFAFVCFGIATLEAVLIGTPLVLAYKAKWLDAFIARMFVKLEHVELLQEAVTVNNLMEEYIKMDREQFFKNSQKLHSMLKYDSKNEMIKLVMVP